MKPLSLYARLTALVMHLALIVALIWGSQSSLGLIGAFGLFLPLPGLLRGRERTHAWASMLLVGYCALLLANGYVMYRAESALAAGGDAEALWRRLRRTSYASLVLWFAITFVGVAMVKS